MGVRKARTEFRDVFVTFSDAAGKDISAQTAQLIAPIDSFKAAITIIINPIVTALFCACKPKPDLPCSSFDTL